jgi:ElaB/YqjD/DUF883 family membrane-anchored ribosome-binding protein
MRAPRRVVEWADKPAVPRALRWRIHQPSLEEGHMSASAKSFENGVRNADSTVVELNRIVSQAEELLKTLGEEGGAAAEAVRQRVMRTAQQARARISEAGVRAKGAALEGAQATDRYVHDNPWRSIAYGAAAGAAVAVIAAVLMRRD